MKQPPEFHTHTPNQLLTLHGFVSGWLEQYCSNFGTQVAHLSLEGDAYLLTMSNGEIEVFEELAHARAALKYEYHFIGTFLPEKVESN